MNAYQRRNGWLTDGLRWSRTAHVASQRDGVGHAGPGVCRALGGVIAIGVLLAQSTVAAGAAPTPLAKLSKAMAAVRSFQIVSMGQSTEQPPSIERVATIGVRHNGVLQLDVVFAGRPSGAGETTVDESVVSGNQVCERSGFNVPLPLTGAFKCRTDAAAAAAFQRGADPSRALTGPGSTFARTSTSSKSIGGHNCASYAFSLHTAYVQSHGTLYIAGTGLPCEQDATVVQPPLFAPSEATKARITLTVKDTWSQFNDPALRIPTITAH